MAPKLHALRERTASWRRVRGICIARYTCKCMFMTPSGHEITPLIWWETTHGLGQAAECLNSLSWRCRAGSLTRVTVVCDDISYVV